jgi:chemotaxis methyl-accepting protein methylase
MLNIVVKKLKQDAKTKGASKSRVQVKRVRDSAGKLVNFRTMDAASETLSGDLTLVFGRNVDRAGRENKKILGVRDVVPAR